MQTIHTTTCSFIFALFPIQIHHTCHHVNAMTQSLMTIERFLVVYICTLSQCRYRMVTCGGGIGNSYNPVLSFGNLPPRNVSCPLWPPCLNTSPSVLALASKGGGVGKPRFFRSFKSSIPVKVGFCLNDKIGIFQISSNSNLGDSIGCVVLLL